MSSKINVSYGGQPSTTHQVNLPATIGSTVHTPPYVNKGMAEGNAMARAAPVTNYGYSNPVPVTATTVAQRTPPVNFQSGGAQTTSTTAVRTAAPYATVPATMIRHQEVGRVSSNVPVAATGFQTSDVRPGYIGDRVVQQGPVYEQRYYNDKNFRQGTAYQTHQPVMRQEVRVASNPINQPAYVAPPAPVHRQREYNDPQNQPSKKKVSKPSWLLPLLGCLCCLLLLGLIFGLLCAFGVICNRGGGGGGEAASQNNGQVDIGGVSYDKNSISISDTVINKASSSSAASDSSGTSGASTSGTTSGTTSGDQQQQNTDFQFPPDRSTSTASATPTANPVIVSPTARTSQVSFEPIATRPVPTSTAGVSPVSSQPVPINTAGVSPVSSQPVPINTAPIGISPISSQPVPAHQRSTPSHNNLRFQKV